MSSRELARPEQDTVAHAFRAVGADSPAAARSLSEIPGVDPAAVVALAARAVVREAQPGRYYLYPGTVHEQRRRVLTTGVVVVSSAAVLVGLPLLVLALR